MELHLKCQSEKNIFNKNGFNLKNSKNEELLLEINHSHFETFSHDKNFRFIHAAFNDAETCLAVANDEGNVFIIDLEMEKYWHLIKIGITTLISFPVLKRQELLIGLDTNSIVFCHLESGETLQTLNGHMFPATDASYHDDGHYCLTSCTAEAIVWDLFSYTQIHKLLLKPEVSLKKAIFVPVTHQILVCFQDDSINVWEFGTFECVKQIIPENWKTHHVRDISITKNGKVMVLGGHSHNLIIFCLDTWVVKKVIELPENISGVKQLQFIPQVFDGGSNKILALLTTSLDIYFFDVETSTFLNEVHLLFGVTSKIAISSTGKYLAAIFTSGTVNIYALGKILLNKHFYDKNNINRVPLKNPSGSRKLTQSLNCIKKELTELLNLEKIRPILKEFGEYPESYRTLIWKTILKLPENRSAFFALSTKECHLSYNNIESSYPLVNKSLCNSLKKLLSNLSHWCPLLGEVNFLPEFIFPFVKLFHTDPLSCFEAVATIIVNWCQNWFEFYPFPPINMLCTLENVLGYHDPDLLEFYLKNNVTSSISICPLFHTVFSEVLSKSDWLKFWDHVVSNEPSFLFLAIVAYNVICRNAIKRFRNVNDIEAFFHVQNPIDLKKLISKTYFYLRETPDDIHCRQFFTPFKPLTSGTYPSFSAYPKIIVDSIEKLQIIRKEKENILEEEMKALQIKEKLDTELKSDDKRAESSKIYEELEDEIRKIVEEEEDRLISQRQKLRNLKREIKLKELEVLEEIRNKALMQRQRKKQLELERLIHDISKRKAREKIEVNIAEEEAQKYYAQLLAKKSQMELDLKIIHCENQLESNCSFQTESLKKNLNENEYESLKPSKTIEILDKLKSIKKSIDDLEIELAEEIGKEGGGNFQIAEFKKLQIGVKSLEQQIQKLVFKNLALMHKKKEKSNSTEPILFDKSFLSNEKHETDKKNNLIMNKNDCKGDVGRKITSRKKKQKSLEFNGRRKTKFQINQKQKTPEKEETLEYIKKNRSEQELHICKKNCQRPRSNLTYKTNNPKFLPVEHKIGDSKTGPIQKEQRKESFLPNDHAAGSTFDNDNNFNTNDYLFQSDSENEIFKSALRTRKQLLELSKKRQKI